MVQTRAEKTTESSDKRGNGAQGVQPRGVSKERWRDVITKDLTETKVRAEDAIDARQWRRVTIIADPATARD
ncbi:unnamed protein product [Haemonchus placei]|uniref:Reverse transcriptase n=1 Tax=Haemonchus placei TaxID=6290 RepID=A0A0N4WDH7_HAEPC|nr:unnamed protein product [Haemonchus placei]